MIVLDPCCGTGAYLIEVMKCVAEQLESEGTAALMGQALLDAATRRLLGFEILTAPFVIAQLQMFLILSELGAKPTATHRPAVFLTNALTGWDGPEQMKLHFPELQAEYDAAHAVKHSGKIIVVIGNPPYASRSPRRRTSLITTRESCGTTKGGRSGQASYTRAGGYASSCSTISTYGFSGLPSDVSENAPSTVS